ncbi:MipA/OmpV family protein, partial [Escherichia coli]|uniref:MipA/OmpV family protein n=1 Tax=Escherichia coli TaxID=562 RepID=UPI00201EC716
SLKTSIKTITYLSDIGCLEIQGASLFSDYYYGISESESRRSGLASYSAQDAWVPYVSLTAKYPIGEHVVLMASAGYSELPEEITDSPMIDRNESFTFVTGVSWRF